MGFTWRPQLQSQDQPASAPVCEAPELEVDDATSEELSPWTAWGLQDLSGNAELLSRLPMGMEDAGTELCEEPPAEETPAEETEGECPQETDEEAVARVTGDASTKLTDGGWLDTVDEGEATGALEQILTLKPELQGQVIDKLTPEQLSALMSKVPEDQREKFESLYQNTTDPAKKVQLWSEVYKARARNKAAAEEQDTDWWDWSPEAEKKRLSNGKWDHITDTTAAEADEETAKILADIESGKAGMAEVDRLLERKEKEQKLEQEYGIALTNDAGSTGIFGWGKRDAATWSKDELDRLETTLSKIPKDHLHDNPKLNEIYRAGDTDWRGLYDPNNGRVSVSNSGASKEIHDRHDPLETLLATSAHEVGHSVEEANPDLSKEFMDAAGWKDVGSKGDLKQQLIDAGMSEADATAKVDALFADQEKGYSGRGRLEYNGKTYVLDEYDTSKVLSFDTGAIPKGSAWAYGDGSPGEYWADFYSRCVHQPETVYDAFVDQPKKDVDARQSDVQRAEDEVKALNLAGATPEQIAAAEENARKAREALSAAEKVQTSRNKQWEIMRGKVFGTDDSDIQKLVAPAGKEAIYDAYKQEAAKCATPGQLSAVREKYKDQL